MAAQVPRPRRIKTYRPRKDVLGSLSDCELLKRYRLDRAGILYVTDLVREALESPTGRSGALSPELKVIVTLRYLATGKMQQCNSDDLGPSQAAISMAINNTLLALTRPDIISRFIKFPLTLPEIERKQVDFMAIAGELYSSTSFLCVIQYIDHMLGKFLVYNSTLLVGRAALLSCMGPSLSVATSPTKTCQVQY